MTNKLTNVLEELLSTLDQVESAASKELSALLKHEQKMLDATLEDVGKLSGQAGNHCADLLEAMLRDAGKEIVAHGGLLECTCLERNFIALDFVVRVIVTPILRAYEKDGHVDCEQMKLLIAAAGKERIAKLERVESSSHSAANKLRTFLSAIQAQGAEKH